MTIRNKDDWLKYYEQSIWAFVDNDMTEEILLARLNELDIVGEHADTVLVQSRKQRAASTLC